MTDAISKSKLLEWLRERELNSHSDIYAASYLSVICEIHSGAFDIPAAADAAEIEKWKNEARLQYRLHNEMIERERDCREQLNQALEALEWVRDAGTDYQSISKARQALQSIRGGGGE